MHRFTLEPWKGSKSRYECPACHAKGTFTRYIDTATGAQVAPHVGRCNREVHCGYHYKPRHLADERGVALPPIVHNRVAEHQQKQTSFIEHSEFVNSFNVYHANNFVQFLIRRFGSRIARLLTDRYLIGTSKHWYGANIFWQVDLDGKVRTGKIMCYDEETGKRIKKPFNHITWVHAVMKLPDYELKQCLYGEHLLNHYMAGQSRDKRTIAIVESEKTAIIASIYLPQYTWMASGSLSNLREEQFRALRGYPVVLFPDLNAYHKWSEKARELSHMTTITVSDLLELRATEQERAEGLDLADYLLQYDHEDFLREAA